MDKTLQELNFKVIKCVDASKSQLEKAIYEFSNLLKDYDVALFYYAGHGVQVDGINYLIPIDAELPDETSVKFEAVAVNYVVDEFERYPDNTNVVILDACRDNPFRSWSRGGARGFKAMKPTSGTIIAFATSEGATAADGKGSNGLYTEHLVKQLKKPQRIVDVFNNTRVAVEGASKGRQSPQEWTKLKGAFYLKKQSGNMPVSNTESEEGALVQGNVTYNYGSISLDSKIKGRLYIDGELKGNIEANSKGNKISKIVEGEHNLRIEGDETWKKTIVVFKEQTTYLKIETNKIKDLSNNLYDKRDGKYYRTVKIGNQVWMAENLAYNSGAGCYVYNNNQENVSKYGYLYNWETAKRICPAGWRLPAKGDYVALVKNVGGKGKTAYNALRPSGSSGFLAPFSGFQSNKSKFIYEGQMMAFWTTSKIVTLDVWLLFINGTKQKANVLHGSKNYSFSVRCLKNN